MPESYNFQYLLHSCISRLLNPDTSRIRTVFFQLSARNGFRRFRWKNFNFQETLWIFEPKSSEVRTKSRLYEGVIPLRGWVRLKLYLLLKKDSERVGVRKQKKKKKKKDSQRLFTWFWADEDVFAVQLSSRDSNASAMRPAPRQSSINPTSWSQWFKRFTLFSNNKRRLLRASVVWSWTRWAA